MMHNNIPTKFSFINSFIKNNIDNLDNNTGIIYRNYKQKLDINEIKNLKNYCSKKNIKFYLSNDFRNALKLGLDGAYLPSFNKSCKHLNYTINTSFLLLGSAHNIKEIREKEKQKVNLIFLSSIFKFNKNYLGTHKFIKLKSFTNKKVVALGGISKDNFKKIKILNCYGVAGISYFEKKKAPKKGPF